MIYHDFCLYHSLKYVEDVIFLRISVQVNFSLFYMCDVHLYLQTGVRVHRHHTYIPTYTHTHGYHSYTYRHDYKT